MCSGTYRWCRAARAARNPARPLWRRDFKGGELGLVGVRGRRDGFLRGGRFAKGQAAGAAANDDGVVLVLLAHWDFMEAEVKCFKRSIAVEP